MGATPRLASPTPTNPLEITQDPEEAHASDVDDDADDDDDGAADEGASSSEEEELFQFDGYDVDEKQLEEASRRDRWNSHSSDNTDEFIPPITRRYRHRGPTLWSSHYFFVNKKQKRILYLSIWAKSKAGGGWADYSFTEGVKGERFHGWEGADGAGARAMGLYA